MSRRSRLAGCVLATALLTACTAAPVRPPSPALDPAQAQALQQQRQARLEALPAWSMQGRIAVSVGDKGGSGRLDWQQQGVAYRISLSARLPGQCGGLAGDGGGEPLGGVEGGPRPGPEAEALLEQATGWPIPVEAMAWWVRGLPASAGTEQVFGADGRLQRLVAGGWTVDYQEWQPAAAGWPDMPRRLQASRDGARVRLVVDRWEAVP